MPKPIRVSPKHGVNPTIPKCFFCGDDKNEIILCGMLVDDKEAPRGMVFDKIPCDQCAEYMRQGIMLISVQDGEEGKENPYRTGKINVVRDDAIRRIVSPESLANQIIEKRCAFIPDSAWKVLFGE